MKIKIIAIILAAIALSGAVIGTAFALNTPKKVAFSTISQFFDDFSEREDVTALMSFLEEGSVNVNAKNIKDKSKNPLFEGEIKGKLYFANNAFMVDSFEIPINKKPLSISFYASEEGIALKESNALKDSIGITKGSAAQSFKDSIFAVGSYSDHELNTKLTKRITDALTVYDAYDGDLLKKDAEKLVREYVKQLYTLICNNAEFNTENTELKLNSKSSKIRVITISLNSESAVTVAEQFYDFIREDKLLKEFLNKHEDFFLSIIKFDNDYTDKMTLDEFTDSLLSELENNTKLYCDKITETLKDNMASINLVTPRFSSKLLNLTYKIGDNTEFYLDLGSDGIKKTNKATVYAKENTTVFEKKENTFTVTKNGSETFSLYADKENRNFKLKILDNVFEGNISSSSNSTAVSVSNILFNGTAYTSDITVTLKKKDTMPQAFEYKQLHELTQEKYESYSKLLNEYFNTPSTLPDYDDFEDEENWSKDY